MCAAEGAARRSAKTMRAGSCGASHGAKIAHMLNATTKNTPQVAGGFARKTETKRLFLGVLTAGSLGLPANRSGRSKNSRQHKSAQWQARSPAPGNSRDCQWR